MLSSDRQKWVRLHYGHHEHIHVPSVTAATASPCIRRFGSWSHLQIAESLHGGVSQANRASLLQSRCDDDLDVPVRRLLQHPQAMQIRWSRPSRRSITVCSSKAGRVFPPSEYRETSTHRHYESGCVAHRAARTRTPVQASRPYPPDPRTRVSSTYRHECYSVGGLPSRRSRWPRCPESDQAIKQWLWAYQGHNRVDVRRVRRILKRTSALV